jgi:hypothetical protein
VNIKKISLAVAGALLVVGCAGNKDGIKPVIKADDDSIKPKPVSVVYHNRNGYMTIKYGPDGKFLELTATGSATVNGDNWASRELAEKVATLNAKSSVNEFINGEQITSTKSVKTLATAFQKSEDNAKRGISEPVVVDSDEVVTNAYKDGDKDPTAINANSVSPNTNSENVDIKVKEAVVTTSKGFLMGVHPIGSTVENDSRTVIVTVGFSAKDVDLAEDLRHRFSKLQKVN